MIFYVNLRLEEFWPRPYFFYPDKNVPILCKIKNSFFYYINLNFIIT